MGYQVIHYYIDCLWIARRGDSQVKDFQPVLEAIAEHTGLPIALDGVFRWVTFSPSRMDRRMSVPNRYFGVFQNGEIKMRGIETRRRDTPALVSQVQSQILELLARAPDGAHLPEQLPAIIALLRRNLRELRQGRMKLEPLLVRQKLTRAIEEYCGHSASAKAARQLEGLGKRLSPGDSVRFLFTRGVERVTAWDLPERPDRREVDVARYTRRLLRAASAVLESVGVEETILQAWVEGRVPVGERLPLLPRWETLPVVGSIRALRLGS
jgi:DNA polymerase elongation subunit (family B)